MEDVESKEVPGFLLDTSQAISTDTVIVAGCTHKLELPEDLQKQDWESNFFKHINKELDAQENLISLKNTLAIDYWRSRFANRTDSFFSLIIELCKSSTNSSTADEGSHLTKIPGLPLLIKAFLIELRTKPILTYPKSMIAASQSLLEDPTLISPLCSIIITRTK